VTRFPRIDKPAASARAKEIEVGPRDDGNGGGGGLARRR
jgi:hypothetical protein